MVGAPKDRHSRQREKEKQEAGRATFLLMAVGIGALALIDQLVVPSVEINPIVYGIMAGVGIGAWKKISGNLGGGGEK